jgi:hypothetical protein
MAVRIDLHPYTMTTLQVKLEHLFSLLRISWVLTEVFLAQISGNTIESVEGTGTSSMYLNGFSYEIFH